MFGVATGQQQQQLYNLFNASQAATQTQLGLLNADLSAQQANANLQMQAQQLKQQQDQAVLNAITAATLGVATGGLGFGLGGGEAKALDAGFTGTTAFSSPFNSNPLVSGNLGLVK